MSRQTVEHQSFRVINPLSAKNIALCLWVTFGSMCSGAERDMGHESRAVASLNKGLIEDIVGEVGVS